MIKKINVLLLTESSIQLKNFIDTYKRNFKKRKLVNIKAIAINHNKEFYLGIPSINITKKKREKKLIEIIKKKKINLLICLHYKWILSYKILSLVDFNAINVHGADTRIFRGNHTTIFHILKNKKNICSTMHFINKEVDRGKIIKIKKLKIKKLDTGQSLQEKLLTQGFDMILNLFKSLINHETNFIKFFKNKNTAEKNSNKAKYIKINEIFKYKRIKNFKDLQLKARAFDYDRHEPAYILLNGIKYYVRIDNGIKK